MKKIILFLSIYACTSLTFAQVTNGLVAKYSFNEENANDEIGTNNGNVNGASLTTDRFGNPNKAYSFDGINDFIDFGDASEFRMGTGNFSISIWVNYSVNQQANIISKRAGAIEDFDMYTISIIADPYFGGASQNINSLLRSSNSTDRTLAAGNLSGNWHHILLVNNYASKSYYYIDGIAVDSSSNPFGGNFDITGYSLVVGYSSESNSNFYNGSVDDIRIYNRALNAAEADSLFNEPAPVFSLTENLVAKYSFNTGTAIDESGNNNHGTVNGATLTTDRFGNANKAYNFDGINDKIDFGASNDFEFGQTNFSISLWTKISTTQFATILCKRNDNPTFDQYSIFVGETGVPSTKLGMYYKPSPGGIGAVQRDLWTTNSVNSDWHNIVVVHKFSDSTTLYIDGQYIGSKYDSFITENFNIIGANLIAGYTNILGTDYYLSGDLDDIRIYSRPLGQAEIDSLLNEQNPLSTLISEIDRSVTLKAYPNPTSSLINIACSEATTISITNVLGQQLILKNVKTTESIDVSNFENGIYFVKDLNSGKTIKFIKQ